MSLDKLEAIPVDTHVLSLAKNQYKFFESTNKDNKKNKSLTDKSYKEIGKQIIRIIFKLFYKYFIQLKKADKFRLLWGEHGK